MKERVEQNHAKFVALAPFLDEGLSAAGLSRKEAGAKVVFGSIQSVARASAEFFTGFSLLVIDECHRVAPNEPISSPRRYATWVGDRTA